MIKLFFISLLVLTSSCGLMSAKKTRDLVKDYAFVKIEKTPVETYKEALHIIKNKTNFLKLLFQQSRDPYYGRPRWSDDCLEDNKIGEVIEKDGNIASISFVLLDNAHEFGKCRGKLAAHKSQLIYFYCSDVQEVITLKFPLKQNQTLDMDQLCN